MWNEITTWISALFDKPIVIAGTSIGTVGAICLFALSKTNFGKRTVKGLKTSFDNVKSEFTTLLTSFNTFKLEALNEIDNYEKEINKSVELVYTKQNDLKELVIVIADNSHNVKVKEAVNNYLKVCEERDIELKENIELATNEIETYKQKLEDKYIQLIKDLEEKITYLEGVANEEENELGCIVEETLQEDK